MMDILENDWATYLNEEFNKEYYRELRNILADEYRTKTIYPEIKDIFNALRLTSYSETKVVIIGQDPYHGYGQAHGLGFSVNPGVAIPPSLLNIYKELRDDLGCFIPDNGYLIKWAKEGVLLLNAVLTVQKGEPNSHKNIGWEQYTDKIISLLNQREMPVIFILWGKNAQKKSALITSPWHYQITSTHPSPLSAYRGFFGSKPFSKANMILKNLNIAEIDWQIPNL